MSSVGNIKLPQTNIFYLPRIKGFSLPQISRTAQKAYAITVLAENISVSSVSSVGEHKISVGEKTNISSMGELKNYLWEETNGNRLSCGKYLYLQYHPY